MRVSRLRTLALLLIVGCGGGDDPIDKPDPSKRALTCEIGKTLAGGTFTPMSVQNEVELVLGFQGFLFVVVQVRTDGPANTRANVKTSVTIEGQEPFGGVQRNLLIRSTTVGASMSEDVNVFLESSNITAYKNKNGVIALRLDGEDWYCVATADVHMVDDDECIHTGDVPICPGD